MTDKLRAVLDGASRGNPGHAAIGIVFYDTNKHLVKKVHRYLGECTNNVAEYSALIACLEEAIVLGAKEILIQSDSELMVKQFNGKYRIKNPNLRTLCSEAHDIIQRKDLKIFLVQVPRSQTKEADRLANFALDMQGF